MPLYPKPKNLIPIVTHPYSLLHAAFAYYFFFFWTFFFLFYITYLAQQDPKPD